MNSHAPVPAPLPDVSRPVYGDEIHPLDLVTISRRMCGALIGAGLTGPRGWRYTRADAIKATTAHDWICDAEGVRLQLRVSAAVRLADDLNRYRPWERGC